MQDGGLISRSRDNACAHFTLFFAHLFQKCTVAECASLFLTMARPDASSTMQTAAEKNAAIRTSYAKLAKVGEGTYAAVFLARHTPTGRKVAIKKIKVVDSKDGMDMSAIREVKVLRELRHPNVIELVDVFSSGSTATPSLNLVLEFLDTDLERLIGDTNLVFRPGDIKSWMLMLCRGLEYCHQHFILHRVRSYLLLPRERCTGLC